ncbi:MAG: SEC-C metal-binding domain-containing protein [Planctomycetaceae bacterium]
MNTKIGPNQECPCGSNRKFKKCCKSKGIPWAGLSPEGFARQQTIRGKNIMFFNHLASCLNLWDIIDNSRTPQERMSALKAAMTPEAVADIHNAIPTFWPDRDDFYRALTLECEHSNGLYVGTYEAGKVAPVLNRHSMYHDSIIFVDPLLDPRAVIDDLNPVIHPEQHLAVTLHAVLIWIELGPWIEAGIVKVIRCPSVFNDGLYEQCGLAGKRRYEQHAELQRCMEAELERTADSSALLTAKALSDPDERWLQMYKDEGLAEKWTEQEFLSGLAGMRARSPMYSPSQSEPQFLHTTTGASYEMAKHICHHTGGHIVTDSIYRIREMEIDRKEGNVVEDIWSQFSLAFQNVRLKSLDGIKLDDTLKLRQDGYLDSMRSFLRKTWRATASSEDYSSESVEDLGAELHERVREANTEWKQIDQNLLKWFGTESFIAGVTVGVVAANTSWLPMASAAAAAAINVYQSRQQRSDFVHRYPAGFFLQPIRNELR